MKIIFLDIDGVLNSAAWFKRRKNLGIELDKDNYHFDPEAVKELNKITDETGAKIVLSSTWRKHRSMESLQELFDKAGLPREVSIKWVNTLLTKIRLSNI